MVTTASKKRSNIEKLFLWTYPLVLLSGLVLRVFFVESNDQTITALAQSYFLPCVFHQLTSWDCPGCGITRSLLSLFLWSPYWSFYFHPMGPLAGLVVFFFWLSLWFQSLKLHFNNAQMFLKYHSWSALILILTWFVLRNF